jgi:hypothetical protein
MEFKRNGGRDLPCSLLTAIALLVVALPVIVVVAVVAVLLLLVVVVMMVVVTGSLWTWLIEQKKCGSSCRLFWVTQCSLIYCGYFIPHFYQCRWTKWLSG